MELEGIEIKKDFISNIVNNKVYNEDVILNYYYRLQSEIPELNLANKIYSLETCNSYWLLDVYRNQKVKDFKRTNLCKDKFCNNCKKVKQASRMGRFIPQIEKIKYDYSLSLLTLTLPNCNGEDLNVTIKKIFKGFKSLNRYLNGDLKIKGLDFSKYGYAGALRSLEITFKGDNYHPHLHIVVALDKNYNKLDEIKENNSFHINSYSYHNCFKNGTKHRELKRVFSDFEVLIQKIWYLLMNNQRVNLKAIESLKEGYSCTLDDIDDTSYYEVFKYMTKATDENDNVLTYENFKILYFALNRVRQIQGYGVFYNFKDDDSIINEVDEYYDVIVNILKAKEDPEEVSQTPQDLLTDNEYTLISRKKIYSYLKNL